LTFGFVKEGPTNTGEHNMTVGWHDEENQILFCSMVSPKGSWHMQFLQDERLRGLLELRHYKRTLGVFAKVSDDGAGRGIARQQPRDVGEKSLQLRHRHLSQGARNTAGSHDRGVGQAARRETEDRPVARLRGPADR
jgi:hypothetical protein